MMLTPEKARRRLVKGTGIKIAPQTFYRWLARGFLDPQKLGVRWFIPEENVNRKIHAIVVEHEDVSV
jgi:hypothetical protein